MAPTTIPPREGLRATTNHRGSSCTARVANDAPIAKTRTRQGRAPSKLCTVVHHQGTWILDVSPSYLSSSWRVTWALLWDGTLATWRIELSELRTCSTLCDSLALADPF
ncbi:hypothetical protein SCHPADRAFT_947904 [Schizopora paradoxa]|uniref:Uncharacterized protein n=1 Tax=Schizopora paradoxa TaxID=27342 RepID=A0A0H2RH07_9AGAM|nr:hypothetical protein SCHPADRAFT_947904 [Schizopora paradoxa]